MMKRAILLVLGIVATLEANALTSLQISEVGAGALSTVPGDRLIRSDSLVAYPVATVGNTRLSLVLTDTFDNTQTSLSFPLYVSELMQLQGQNTPAITYRVDSTPESDPFDTVVVSPGIENRRSSLFVGMLSAGPHVLAARVDDGINNSYSILLPLFNEFLDADQDGIANSVDPDDDNDGVLDAVDIFPFDPRVSIDTDQDGIGNALDPDDDNDGILDAQDNDPLNVSALNLGPPQQVSQLFSLSMAEFRLIDTGVDVVQSPLMLGNEGAGLRAIDGADQLVSVDTTRNYTAMGIKIFDNRVTGFELLLPFNDSAYKKPAPLPGTLNIDSGAALTEFVSEQLTTGLAGELVVYRAGFRAAGSPDPFLRVDSSISTSDGVTSISTFADRSIDDDLIPAFADTDLDGDGVLNTADAFPEDPLLSVIADNDGDGISDANDPDDDNDGVNDVDDAFPFVSLDGRLDTDSDGRPNECDTACLSTGMTGDDDDDNDGVADTGDAFPLLASESVDSDGDGVGDNADAAPNDPNIGARLPFTAANVSPEYFRLDEGALSDPTINLSTSAGGTRYLFDSNANTLTVIDQAGESVFDVSFANDVETLIPTAVTPADSFPTVSRLIELGVITQSAGDNYIAANGDVQINVKVTNVSITSQLLEDGADVDRFLVQNMDSFRVVDDNDRIALQGGINTPDVEILRDKRELVLVDAASLTGIAFTSSELSGPWAITSFDDPQSTRTSGRITGDIATFENVNFTGTTQVGGRNFTWTIDANGILVMTMADGTVFRHRRLQQFANSSAVLTAMTDPTGARHNTYALALPQDTTATVQPLLDQFLMSSFVLTNPDAYDESGGIKLGSYFGFRLESSGIVTSFFDGNFNLGVDFSGWVRRFWSVDQTGVIALVSRAEPNRSFSECDLASDQCNVHRSRYWQPIAQVGDRLFVLEWAEVNDNAFTFPSGAIQSRSIIPPRVSYYEAFPLDNDQDGITDASDPDIDGDGVANGSDRFPENPEESDDTDGDGIGNNADPDDDNDGVADIDDAFPFDSTRSVAIADADNDGIADSSDNCPSIHNVSQSDSDGDGKGDACDNNTGNLPIKLTPNTVLALPIKGEQLSSPFGEFIGVPSNATAVSLNVTAVAPDGPGFITVWPCGVSRPLASNVNYVAGDIVPNGVIASIGNDGSVCFFSSSATDLIVDIAGWFEGSAYTGATPTRLTDTRNGTGGFLGRTGAANPLTIKVTELTVLDAAGISTIVPTDIGAVALNVTVVTPTAAGFITVWPCDVARPLSSNVNYVAGQVVANGVVAPVSADGTVCLFSQADTDVVVDLAGWFPGESFTGSTPTRLADTRDGTGGRLGAITAANELSVAVHNITLTVGGQSEQVPFTATAAALNITVVNPTSAGFITVWPCGVARPLASNLNFVAGQVVANNVVAPIGNEGSLCVYSNVQADVIVDIAGWFNSNNTGDFVGTTPQRFVDTRFGTGPAPQ